ncbi:F0F1 ATP synthase subunit A [Thermomicrobium roseum]|uniref:ATP synthase subunit a n=1 Tax=Thermomicrobium roseum (strain ATCC 27502 / DSM 5159 / P-2) TaxID=309801 RepID=B9L1H5_THERP|nr:F0F1 ATP synthase subunit A [Thermomicrobium roseum]ACM04862.1 ATP synthase F0, A subunit [Thermomicrobium roseum DSM 5159]MBO9405415.1 F0F1 ATP synthase subunit A [Thermomicrobium sp.]
MELHISVKPETLWSLPLFGHLTLRITNSFLTMLLVMLFLIILGSIVARRAQLIPGRLQSVVEMVVEFLLGLVEGTAGKKLGRRIFPLIGGLFIFIIVANYTGLLPGIGTIGIWHEGKHALVAASEGATGTEHGGRTLVPLFRPPSADLNMTLAMALISYVAFQVAGISAHGVWGRIKHMANPPFLLPIEIISELSRIVSLSFRLFGNIFAGETLLTVMYGIANAIKITVVGLVIPVIFLYLEVLFGFIQALIFAVLTLIYIALASAHEHEEEHEAEGHHRGSAHDSRAVPLGASGD